MIAVVGASSSGLYLAWRLAREGRDVHLFENGEGPSIRRRLIVTPSLLRLLDIPPSIVLSKVKAYEFISPKGKGVVPLKQPDLVIERQDLLGMLLKRAEHSGVKIHWEVPFVGFSDGEPLFLSSRGEESFEVSWIVAADGARSAVGRALGLQLEVVHLLQARVILPPSCPEGLSKIWFRPDLTPYFLWLFPDSPTSGVLGAIAEGKRAVHRAVEELLSSEGLEAQGYEAGVVTLYQPTFRPERGKILFVGDAAGHVKVTTVGGTVTGLRGARACARAILRGGGYLRELLPLRRELLLHRWIRRILNRMGPRHYEGLIRTIGRGAFLGSFSRDELSSNLPLLPLKAPRATLKGLCLILRVLLDPHR